MNYLSSAFSLNMLSSLDASAHICPVEPSAIPDDAHSIIGHPDTAAIVSGILGRHIPANRESVELRLGDVVYVAQYRGPRLPEGSTTLPDGATIEFARVIVGPYIYVQ